MIIRKARLKDKKMLLKVFKEFYVDYNRKRMLSKAALEFEEHKNIDQFVRSELNKYLSDKKYILLIAMDKNNILGYICGQVIKKPGRFLDKEGFIEEWFVREKYRNNKIGKALYETLIEDFKKFKCTHLSVGVYSDNKNVIEIYHALGFIDFSMKLKRRI